MLLKSHKPEYYVIKTWDFDSYMTYLTQLEPNNHNKPNSLSIHLTYNQTYNTPETVSICYANTLSNKRYEDDYNAVKHKVFGNKNNSQNIDGDVHKFKTTQGKILKSSDVNLFDILDSRSNQSHLASDRTITIKYKDHKLKVFKPEGFDQLFSSNVLHVLETLGMGKFESIIELSESNSFDFKTYFIIGNEKHLVDHKHGNIYLPDYQNPEHVMILAWYGGWHITKDAKIMKYTRQSKIRHTTNYTDIKYEIKYPKNTPNEGIRSIIENNKTKEVTLPVSINLIRENMNLARQARYMALRSNFHYQTRSEYQGMLQIASVNYHVISNMLSLIYGDGFIKNDKCQEFLTLDNQLEDKVANYKGEDGYLPYVIDNMIKSIDQLQCTLPKLESINQPTYELRNGLLDEFESLIDLYENRMIFEVPTIPKIEEIKADNDLVESLMEENKNLNNKVDAMSGQMNEMASQMSEMAKMMAQMQQLLMSQQNAQNQTSFREVSEQKDPNSQYRS